MSPFLVLAAEGANAGGGQFLLPGLLFFGVMVYVMIIRPQNKQMKDQQALISSLKKGDDVITQGGILGKVVAVQDRVVTVEVASSLKVRVLKSSIQGRFVEEPAKAEDAKDAGKEEK
jgi:preprotein translocase subunit YajC